MNGQAAVGIARIGGILFLVSLIAGGFGEGFAPSQLIAPTDAAATAHHIIASDALFRFGFASYLVEGCCNVALAVVLFVLLRRLAPLVAGLGALFHVMAAAVFAFAELFYFVPSLLLGGDAYLKSFSADQLNSLVLLSLNVYGLGGGMSLVFYGVGWICFGYLIFRSGYLPAWLGILVVVGGIGFAIRTFALILLPNLSTSFLQVPMIIAIVAVSGWLLVRGVDIAKWEQAPAAAGA